MDFLKKCVLIVLTAAVVPSTAISVEESLADSQKSSKKNEMFIKSDFAKFDMEMRDERIISMQISYVNDDANQLNIKLNYSSGNACIFNLHILPGKRMRIDMLTAGKKKVGINEEEGNLIIDCSGVQFDFLPKATHGK